MISPGPDTDLKPATPNTMPPELFYRLNRLTKEVEELAIALRRNGCLDLQFFVAQPIICRLETAAGILRGLES